MKTYNDMEREVLRAVRDLAGQHVCRQAIRALQQTKTAAQEDRERGLRSYWESICYQVQIEESIVFDLYLIEVDRQIEHFTRQLAVYQRSALWLMSNEGLNWRDDYDVSMDSDTSIETIAREIRNNYLMIAAERWSNNNLRWLRMRFR